MCAPVAIVIKLLAELIFWKKSCGLLRKSSDFFYGMRQRFSEAATHRFPLRNKPKISTYLNALFSFFSIQYSFYNRG